MKRYCYIILLGLLLLSCSERQTFISALDRAKAVLDEHPDSALRILDSLGSHEADFGRHFRMRYRLYRLSAYNKLDTVFRSTAEPQQLADYFEDNGTANECVLARYLLGRAYSDMGEAPNALQTYYTAIAAADTLSGDCDYNTLRGIYGQMAYIFHRQNLPHDEIWAFQHYIDYTRRTSNEEEYIMAKAQLVRPYYLLGEKDSVLHLIDDTFCALRRLGNHKRAAALLVTAIYIHVEQHDLSKAQQAIDIFEHESGLFDRKGNVARGREGYYYIKGFFELGVNQVDSAEFYFRRALENGYLSEGYKGLLSIYKVKNNIDSIVHFANLYEAAQDSLHNRMQTNAIHQMSALYNYSRSQKEAEQEREKSRSTLVLLNYIILIAIALSVIIVIICWLYRKAQKEKRVKIARLRSSLANARKQRRVVQEELQKLKDKDYEGMIVEKENQEAELTRIISQLQAENTMYKNSSLPHDNLDDFLDSPIAQLFIKKAKGKAERPEPTEAEWKMLLSQFCKDNPFTFKSFGSGKSLSLLEQRICILIILDIPERDIAKMTTSQASTVSNAKTRANEKLYGKKEAHSLKTNLIHALRGV